MPEGKAQVQIVSGLPFLSTKPHRPKHTAHSLGLDPLLQRPDRIWQQPLARVSTAIGCGKMVLARYPVNARERVEAPLILVLDDLQEIRGPTIFTFLSFPALMTHTIAISHRAEIRG